MPARVLLSVQKKHAPTVLIFSILVLTLLVNVSSMPNAFAESASYSSPQNLSNDAGPSEYSITAAYESNVYVAWVDYSTSPAAILFRSSLNNGKTFGSVFDISSATGDSGGEELAVSGAWLYAVWFACVGNCNINSDVFFRASDDNGTTWGPTINVSNDPGISDQPEIATSGNDVYVAWYDNTTGHLQVFFSYSLNNGASFSKPANLSNAVGIPFWYDTTGNGLLYNVGLAAYKSDVYVTWSDNSTGTYQVYFRVSVNHGKNFASGEILSDLAFGDQVDPVVATAGPDVYIAWTDPDNGLLYFVASQNSGTSFGSTLTGETPGYYAFDLRIAAEGVYVFITYRGGATTDEGSFNYIYFVESQNIGASLGTPVRIGDGCCYAQISLHSSDIYLAWTSIAEPLGPMLTQVYVNESTNHGSSFGTGVDVSHPAAAAGGPSIQSLGKYVYVSWQEENSSGSKQVYFSFNK